MIEITKAASLTDLEEILILQQGNLPDSLSTEEKNIEGFVMVNHRMEDLKAFAEIAPQIIAKDETGVCAYALAMPRSLRKSIPMLIPMFDQLNNIKHQGKSIADYNYIIVGQVCIKKGYRGIRLFDQLYEVYKKEFEINYDFAITEISTSNIRSMRAHIRVGFKTIHTFRDEFEEWNIVCWDWKGLLLEKEAQPTLR
jgi:hypothetical protein